MGNVHSDVTAGVKGQADADVSKQKIYSLVNVKKRGILIDIMKKAVRKRDFTGVDDKIYHLVKPFLYEGGDGKKVPIAKLIRMRNKERPANKQLPPKQEEESDSGSAKPNFVMRVFNWLRRLKSNPAFRRTNVISFHEEQFREVCWSLDERGSVGETALHICMLVSTPLHNELARRLVRLFPKLVNDIYLSDEFYGESALHMAVVNEDPLMLKFLLNYGADVNSRCIGNFFCAADQKESRIDVLDDECYQLKEESNYQGHVYWGEYPLSFAAFLGLEDCYRILRAKGADPNNSDTNGNTVLHMTVIADKIDMFDLAYELGANLDAKNKQKLTPLALAARLSRVEMFFHILKLQREIYWQFCDIAFAEYPLDDVDSIDVQTGDINNTSALSVVAFGDDLQHLDMFEGLLIEILQAKWNTFVKKKFYHQLAFYCFYFLITFFTFILRPAPLIIPKNEEIIGCPNQTISQNSTNNLSLCLNFDFCLHSSTFHQNKFNHSFNKNLNKEVNITPDYCYLLRMDTKLNKLRRAFELFTVFGAIIYLLIAWQEVKSLSWHIFLNTIIKVPGRVLFLISCLLIIFCLPIRFMCIPQYEDRIMAFAMFLTPMYFLFFCRGFKAVGPFVVMIYKMIVSDLLCFVIIYMIFVFGFAEAFFVIFRSHSGNGTNYFGGVVDSIMSMFLMSLNEFYDIYNEFDKTDHPYLAKLLFVFYMILVSILLVNMLIAMMGKTYQDIASRPNEWLRQWARIVLVVERGVASEKRLFFQKKYSKIKNGKRVFVTTWETEEEEKIEIAKLKELKQANTKLRNGKI